MRVEAVLLEKSCMGRSVELVWDAAVAAGYTGRDQANVRAHVEELRKLGVSAPSQVPTLYWIEPCRVCPTGELWVVGERTSGEAEVFLARDGAGDWAVTVASDHTDRDVETVSVAKAKQVCSKVIGPICWSLAEVRDHWDALELRCWVDGKLYQDGKLGQLLPPERLIELAIGDTPIPGGQVALFSGTLPILGGETAYGSIWTISLSDSILKRELKIQYSVRLLPDRS